MKYMGSKNRIAKYILPIILKDRKPGQWYVEPFVGGANIIDKVDCPRIGADSHRYLIAVLNAASHGWMPDQEYSEQEYINIKANKDIDLTLTGYAGFALSYGGKFFGGWRRDSKGIRNYPDEAYRNAVKQFPKLEGVYFVCTEYDLLMLPCNSIIYCDPPYANTTKYKDDFDHDEFWQWCRDKHAEGHTIFISEYNAPDDFECVWQREQVSSLTKNTGAKKGIEKLFRFKQNPKQTCA